MNSRRVRMRKPRGATGDSLMPVMLYGGHDLFYGPKVEKRLIRIESRNKCAWLWCEVWRGIAAENFDDANRYAVALQLIERHAERIDRIKGENEWSAILRGKRWSEGIVFPEERQATKEYLKNILPAVKDKGEESTMPDDYDFVLMGHDMAQGLMWPKPPDWATMADCAKEIDRRNADAFVMHAEADGFKPREAE